MKAKNREVRKMCEAIGKKVLASEPKIGILKLDLWTLENIDF